MPRPQTPPPTDPAAEDQDSRRLRAALRGTFPASDPSPSWAGPSRAEAEDEDEDEDDTPEPEVAPSG